MIHLHILYEPFMIYAHTVYESLMIRFCNLEDYESPGLDVASHCIVKWTLAQVCPWDAPFLESKPPSPEKVTEKQ